MDRYVRKISHEFSYLDSFEDSSKLLILIGLLLFTGIPLTVIAIFAVYSLA